MQTWVTWSGPPGKPTWVDLDLVIGFGIVTASGVKYAGLLLILCFKYLFIQRSEGIAVDPSAAMANDTIYQVIRSELYFQFVFIICFFSIVYRCLKQIQQQLNMLKKSTQECGVEIEKTRQMQEHHSINFYKHHQISG